MKYALLIYSSPESRDVPEDQLKSIVGEYEALADEPGVLDGMQLQGTESATTVRVQNGEALLSDGPFVDAKEYIGGFFLLEADNLDEATALAARVPAARMGDDHRPQPRNRPHPARRHARREDEAARGTGDGGGHDGRARG